MKSILFTTLLAAVVSTSASPATLVCTLTGKTIDSCCCVTGQNGKLHCTLVNKDIDTCCCKGMKHKSKSHINHSMSQGGALRGGQFPSPTSGLTG